MAKLSSQLDLDRCPHCGVDRPLLHQLSQWETHNYLGENLRRWRVYQCSRCGGVVTAAASNFEGPVTECYPSVSEVDSTLPEKARAYLQQALSSLSAPAGAIMLAASAVDAMLKAKGYKDGSLYSRIDKASAEHMITPAMAQWAHDVRLDANDQRHADDTMPLPTPDEAKRAVDFAAALGEFMFVLPARVQRGISEAKGPS